MLLYEHLAKLKMLLAVLVCTCLKIAKYNFWSCMNILSELASFWVNKWHKGLWTDDEIALSALTCRLVVVTAQETWFTLHTTQHNTTWAGYCFKLQDGRAFFFLSLFMHTCLMWFMEKLGWEKNKKKGKKYKTHCPRLLCIAVTDCRTRCQVMFSQLESVESVMKTCMNVNMIQ